MAVKTRAELKSENASDFPDNTTRLISAADLRGQMDDTADSALFPEDIAGLDLSEANVTADGDGTKTLAEWTADIAGGGGGGGFIHEPGTSPPAYFRAVQDRLRDTVHLLDFIPVAEHAAIADFTSTYDALPAIHSTLAQFTDLYPTAYTPPGPRLILPLGKIYISGPIELHCACTIEGAGGANMNDSGFPTIIEVAADQHGIIVQYYDTYGDTSATDWATGGTHAVGTVRYSYPGIYEVITAGGGTSTVAPSHLSGDVTGADGYTWRWISPALGGGGSILRGFSLQSLGGTTGHGIWMRNAAEVHDVSIRNFPGNGYHMQAASGGTGSLRGNANRWRIYGGRVADCTNGLYTDSADTNAGTAINVDCSGNDGWGFWDSSFLGNTYIGCHTNGNGLAKAARQYAGVAWICVDGTLGATTVPGTNGAVWWRFVALGSPLTAWVSGTTYAVAAKVTTTNGGFYQVVTAGGGTSTSEPNHMSATTTVAYADGYSWKFVNTTALWFSGDTTIIEGGCFKLDGSSNSSLLVGCYAEGGQPAYLAANTWSISGGFAKESLSTNSQGTLWAGGMVNKLIVDQLDSVGVSHVTTFGGPGALPNDFIWQYKHNTFAANTMREGIDQTLGALVTQAQNSFSFRTWYKTLAGTTVTFGRSAPVPYAVYIDRLFVGTGRQISSATAVPTTGNWAAGDFMLNSAPTAGEPFAWRCIATGTPGTWEPLYASATPL